jgi:exosortase K
VTRASLGRWLERARVHRWAIAGACAALAIVIVAKTYYRTATAGDLTWILAPTARLVSWLSGAHFVYEAGPGWIDPNVGFIIAAPCAGLNFAMAAFLALAAGAAPGMRSAHTAVSRLVAAAALSYVATLVINPLRITLAVAMHRGTIDISRLGGDRAELHRIEGIVVYLGGLIALYAIARRLTRGGGHAAAG